MKRVGLQVVRPPEESRRGLILYVEDDGENWHVAQLRLESQYELLQAATDIEACAQIRKHGPQLDALLMDIELKGSALNGLELTKVLRGKSEHPMLPPYVRNLPAITCPIVFVTAYGARYPEVDLLAMGGNKVIHKPVDFRALDLALSTLGVGAKTRL
jgi:CheY-like chemotaxis protein